MAYDLRPLELRAVWSTAYVNSLPDSSFLLVDGKNRYFPVKDADGKIDVAHLKNALARIPQASTLTADQRAAAMAKAKKMAAAHPGIGDGKTADYQGTAGSGRSREPAEVLTRSYALELEVRSDGDGRTLVGRAVPYGATADIGGGNTERFVPGAFARQIAGGQLHAVKLYASHHERINGMMAVGKTVELAERPDGLVGAWRMYDTAHGNDALQLAREGELTGLSVGFRALSTRRGPDGALERHAAHLDHVTLTDQPAYSDAQVLAVRSAAHPAVAYRTALLQARSILDSVTTVG